MRGAGLTSPRGLLSVVLGAPDPSYTCRGLMPQWSTCPHRPSMLLHRSHALLLAVLALLCSTIGLLSCGPPADPEVIAIAYLRAVNSGDSDTAVDLLDMEEIVSRIDEQIVIVQQSDAESFLRDSVETVLWGLFRESAQAEYSYDAQPADLEGDMAKVVVAKIDPEGERSETVLHLRRTPRGWRISGESLDPLITYVIQRLEERY